MIRKRHSLLTRQLKKLFASGVRVPPELEEFLGVIDAAYCQFDDDRAMLERSLDLSSKELMGRNSEMRALLQAFPDIYFRLDGAGVILECSSSRPDDLYRPVAELCGRRLQSIIPDGLGKRLDEAIDEVIRSGKISSIEYALDVPSGKKHWEARIVPTLNGQLLMIVRDITERAATEEALVLAEAQFQQSQKMEMVGRLAGGIAHDFNNLLTTIMGMSEMAIMRLGADHPVAEDVKEVLATSGRAAALTQQLLAFSRRQVIQPKTIDLNEAVLNSAKLLRRLIGEDVELTLDLGPSVGPVRVDPGQLEQVVVNLAVNARDAMPSGGVLTVETSVFSVSRKFADENPGSVPGDYVKLVVRDTGTGMTEEVLEHVFEPFFTTKELGKGTGLGLATVYGIVKQNGGFVSVVSEQGKGASFSILLPRAVAPEPAPEKSPEPQQGPMPRGRETVLVVEDEEAVRRLGVRVLRMQGYTVLEARDGVEGQNVVEADAARRIRLVVTDMVMPRAGGKRLSDFLTKTRPDVGVIMTTGYTQEAVLRDGAEGPARRLLHKPFSPRELAQAVRDMLDRPHF